MLKSFLGALITGAGAVLAFENVERIKAVADMSGPGKTAVKYGSAAVGAMVGHYVGKHVVGA